jgi:hypothetical protein
MHGGCEGVNHLYGAGFVPEEDERADEQCEEQDAQENLQKLFHIMSVFCVCCEFRGLFFADRVHGFDSQCPGRRDDACQQAAQNEDTQREHPHTEGDLP